MKIPRWLKLREQIDYYYFVLSTLINDNKNLTGIELMIDNATGYSAIKTKQIKKIVGKIKKLREEYDNLVTTPSIK